MRELSRLPGIGRKTAMRLALHLLRRDRKEIQAFADSIVGMADGVRYCHVCHNISDQDTCPICANPARDHTTVCVVETVEDVIAIEATNQYRGVYHVLGGVISPIDAVGPQDLEIQSLVERVAAEVPQEIILALSPTMEGDTTAYYIYRKLQPTPARITTIARGIAQNDQLHYADELTLGRSILDRHPFTI